MLRNLVPSLVLILAAWCPLPPAFAAEPPAAPHVEWSVQQAGESTVALLVTADRNKADPARLDIEGAYANTRALKEALRSNIGLTDEQIVELRGEQVNRDGVQSAIQDLVHRQPPGVRLTLIVYWCGHGWGQKDQSGKQLSLFTYNTKTLADQENRFAYLIALKDDLFAWLGAAGAELRRSGGGLQPVVLIDACQPNLGYIPESPELTVDEVWQAYAVAPGQYAPMPKRGAERPEAFVAALAQALGRLSDRGEGAGFSAVLALAKRIIEEQKLPAGQQPQFLGPKGDLREPLLVRPAKIDVQVRVCDSAASGAVLTEATVVLDEQPLPASGGTCKLAAVAVGRHRLRVSAPGMRAYAETLDLARPHHGQTLTVVLPPAIATLTGHLKGGNGMTVRVAGLASKPREGVHLVEARANLDGRFELLLPVPLKGEDEARMVLEVVSAGVVVQTVAVPAWPRWAQELSGNRSAQLGTLTVDGKAAGADLDGIALTIARSDLLPGELKDLDKLPDPRFPDPTMDQMFKNGKKQMKDDRHAAARNSFSTLLRQAGGQPQVRATLERWTALARALDARSRDVAVNLTDVKAFPALSTAGKARRISLDESALAAITAQQLIDRIRGASDDATKQRDVAVADTIAALNDLAACQEVLTAAGAASASAVQDSRYASAATLIRQLAVGQRWSDVVLVATGLDGAAWARPEWQKGTRDLGVQAGRMLVTELVSRLVQSTDDKSWNELDALKQRLGALASHADLVAEWAIAEQERIPVACRQSLTEAQRLAGERQLDGAYDALDRAAALANPFYLQRIDRQQEEIARELYKGLILKGQNHDAEGQLAQAIEAYARARRYNPGGAAALAALVEGMTPAQRAEHATALATYQADYEKSDQAWNQVQDQVLWGCPTDDAARPAFRAGIATAKALANPIGRLARLTERTAGLQLDRFDAARKSDSLADWKLVYDYAPETALAGLALERINALDQQAQELARKSGTIAAWNDYLSLSTDEQGRTAAQAAIRDLLVKDATKRNTREAWNELKKAYPDGPAFDTAERGLDDLLKAEAEAAAKGGDAEAEKSRWLAYLRERPNGAHRALANRKLDHLALGKARAGKTQAQWREYLDAYPDGEGRVEATEAINSIEKVGYDSERRKRAAELAQKVSRALPRNPGRRITGLRIDEQPGQRRSLLMRQFADGSTQQIAEEVWAKDGSSSANARLDELKKRLDSEYAAECAEVAKGLTTVKPLVDELIKLDSDGSHRGIIGTYQAIAANAGCAP